MSLPACLPACTSGSASGLLPLALLRRAAGGTLGRSSTAAAELVGTSSAEVVEVE